MTRKVTRLKVTINSEGLAKANGVKVGGVVDVECRDGVPITRYWRNRFKDATTDGAISGKGVPVKVVKKTKTTVKGAS